MNDAHRPNPDGPQLRTLLLTDLCDSTTLVERLGDGPAAGLFREHDRLVLQLQQRWRGRLIDRSDGLLLLFERPIDGLGFALDYARGLRELGASRKVELKARAGLHVGEVLTWRNSDEAVRVGAKPVEVEGLAKPMAGRLMATARPGQILLSAVAEPLAHRAARELGERGQQLLWKSHGRWRFKGVPEPQEIYEVGEPGIAPLRAPPNGPKAWRDIPLWRRPAALAAELAVLAVIGTGIWFATRPQPAIAFNQRDWVVVGDLRNLTGQSVLDDSLEQAFRISLEQSRYVNVLSDLKARDTLDRMHRKPDTVLDRSIASEIALRDGARAVILPTVAEVGGRVRVSAEVIDPHTQTTVYAESADGVGAASALASIDEVTTALRGKLGEALKNIEKDSEPLPKVATGNLDALRAYALGAKAYAHRQFDDALQYFQRAVQIDPNFALAHMGVMRVYVSNADTDAARPYLEKAQQLRDHLTPREAMYLDAWAAEFGPKPSRNAPQKWRMLAEFYPDYFAGRYQYAWSEFLANDFKDALAATTAATAPQEPLRNVAFELAGRVHLSQERYAKAIESFKQAEASGHYPPNRRHAAALAAMRRFDEANRILDGLTADGDIGSANLTVQFERISVALDQNDLARARELSRKAAEAARDAGPLVRHPIRFTDLLVRSVSGQNRPSASEIEQFAQGVLNDAAKPGSADQDDFSVIALAAVRLAQRQGERAVAERLLPRVAGLVDASGNVQSQKLLRVAYAEQARLGGDPQRAVRELRALLDDREPFQARVALRDALLAAGRSDEAARENQWIAEHRGRAYAEPFGGQVFVAMNVADAARAQRESARTVAVIKVTAPMAAAG
ncbi:putative peptide modification system cyclase [Lysobacter sp. BMK333-48F3]|uniref:putative peptide modification system cyclase n=1 Tax=Lysobacter sp. BMK333-48F3 TaxID=2867962 RepID=UPI001C8B1364|nr:putative peptide modification system cyclase [Lysobacter sp. BMK333-48F3]MBX9401344.1 putative peptide modification system cyclase [Lysobacter sp. BMK333-48F3]